MSANGQNPAQPADGNLPQPSKHEVGWYFVEQYYNTLSASPEKVHLFYGKHSKFIYGDEAVVANVAQGRAAIEQRIHELDFQDCKVRISNVDSMGSFDNIVIQVIGETSNKQEAPRKFVQTFVLAQQDKGYFVLNDIFRFIADDYEVEQPAEEVAAPADAPVESEAPAATEASVEEKAVPVEPEAAPEPVPEPVAEPAPEPVAEPIVETPTEPVKEPKAPEPEPAAEKEKVPEAAPEAAPEATPEAASEATPEAAPEASHKVAPEAAPEEIKPEEKPTETVQPEEKPAAPAPKVEEAAPAPAPAPTPKPAAPRTWASLAAAAGSSKPAAPPAVPKATPAPVVPKSVPAAAPAVALKSIPTAAPANDSSSSEWQTAGSDSKRQNRPQSTANGSNDRDGVNAYVKSVSDKVTDSDLRNALSVFGQVTYCDINRSKNCAFVDFANMEGFKAAANANPHNINGESISIELRKPKSGNYGYNNSGYNNRGSMGRGRGFDGNRGNYGRGGFRSRGGGAPRGRGPQVANS